HLEKDAGDEAEEAELQRRVEAVSLEDLRLFRAEERLAGDGAVARRVHARVEFLADLFARFEVGAADDRVPSLGRLHHGEEVVVLDADELDVVVDVDAVALLAAEDL